jgi:arsenite methyltransferase
MECPASEATKQMVAETYGRIASDSHMRSPGAEQWGYSPEDVGSLPDTADLGLSCGNPLLGFELYPGAVVVDLGSGAGLDAFIAARKVGPTGRVIGVDFAASMVERAAINARQAGCDNVEFRLGEIEALPIESGSVDVVTSNCVLNLVPDKRRAFREIERILRPGGRFVASDTVLLSMLPDWAVTSQVLYACCVSGAISKRRYLDLLVEAGLSEVEVLSERDVTRVFAHPVQTLSPTGLGLGCEDVRLPDAGVVGSITVRAFKPDPRREARLLREARPQLVLVLGLSEQIPALARALNVEPIFLVPRADRVPKGARFYQVDLADNEAIWNIVTQLRNRHDILGVCTLEGYFLSAAVDLAARLNLTLSMSEKAALCGENKLRAREVLRAAGIPGPNFGVATSLDRARLAAEELGWPLVVKPLNDSNSRLVAFCSDGDSLAASVKAILGTPTNLVHQRLVHAVLLESFVDGTEYSAEVIVHEGKAQTAAVCEKQLGPLPYFVEIGHVVPAHLSDELSHTLCTTAEAAVVAVGAQNCVAHVELKVRGSEVSLIEVNLRPAGGRMPELISNVTGWDLNNTALRLALGRPIQEPESSRAAVGIYHCLTVCEPSHVFYEQHAIELNFQGPAPLVEIDCEPGTLVHPVNSSGGGIYGRILAYAASIDRAHRVIEDVKIALNLRVEKATHLSGEEVRGRASGSWRKGCC